MAILTSSGALREFKALTTDQDIPNLPEGNWLCVGQTDTTENGLWFSNGSAVQRIEWSGAGVIVDCRSEGDGLYGQTQDGLYILPDASAITWGVTAIDMSTARIGGAR